MSATSAVVDADGRVVGGLAAQAVRPGGGLLPLSRAAAQPYLFVAVAPPAALLSALPAGAFKLPAPGQLAMYGPAPPGEPRPLVEITAQGYPRPVPALLTVRWRGVAGQAPAPPEGLPEVTLRCQKCGALQVLSARLQTAGGASSVAVMPADIAPYRLPYAATAPWLPPVAARLQREYPCDCAGSSSSS